jgi:hypothetical protein
MIEQILAYITAGLIALGWLLTIIFDLLKKIHTNKKNTQDSEANG